jgi:hypothetical protein
MPGEHQANCIARQRRNHRSLLVRSNLPLFSIRSQLSIGESLAIRLEAVGHFTLLYDKNVQPRI